MSLESRLVCVSTYIISVSLGKRVEICYVNTLENVLKYRLLYSITEFSNHISIVLLLLVSPTFYYNNMYVAEMMRVPLPRVKDAECL